MDKENETDYYEHTQEITAYTRDHAGMFSSSIFQT